MKTQRIFINTIFTVLSVFSLIMIITGCNNDRKDIEDSFSTIERHFFDPPASYRTAPFMVWNGKVTEAEIDRMLKEFKDVGCGGAFIHPRPGMITEYLGDEWFSLFEHTVNKGKELGLDIWIYDENSYPSGFAGGHVPAEMPESYNQGQGLELIKTDILPSNIEDYYLCFVRENNKWRDVTNNIDTYKNKNGDYYLYKKTYMGKSDWYGGFSYVDLLVPGVTEKFIDVTMKGYEKIYKNKPENVVRGIFTDEPNISSPGGIRWTPDLFDVFQHKWGYDLKPLLPLLSEETGNWKEVRHNYMETLLQLFIDRWSKPWNQYCEENNLKWTGHYWEHGWPQMNDGPDNMAMYAWHQVPAIDMLFNQFDETEPQAQFGNIRAVKELRSSANQMGNERTLSETYGGGGWDETFKDFKRLGDWEYVLGVNFMNQHLSHMSLTGARKYDYPPVFTYVSPWWNNYRELNDYYGRLSLVLSKGIQKNNILVLEPNSTLWSYYSHVSSSPKLMEIGKSFQSFVTALEQHQVEYDLGSENIIKDHGTVDKNNFIVGNASYQIVVLPPMMETLNKSTFDLLSSFVDNGGSVVSFSSPQNIDGKENIKLSSLLEQSSVHTIPSLSKAVIDEYLKNIDCNITFNNGDLYHQRRQFKDGDLIFLVNSSMNESVDGVIRIPGNEVVEMDLFEGAIYSYDTSSKNDTLEIPFEIDPAGSLLLFSSKKKMNDYPRRHKKVGNQKVEALGELKINRVRENVLNIDFCDLTVKGNIYKKQHFSYASDIAFKTNGFESGNPWNTSVQYKRNILDRDTFSNGGFKAVYTFNINDNFDFSGMKLISERPELFSVLINGESISSIPGEWWLDRSFGVYNIGDKVKRGENIVELSVSPMSIFAEIEPVYIIGNFSVVPEKEGWSISSPIEKLYLGSWKRQKQPFYSWEVNYTKDYNINNIEGEYAVKLNEWAGTVAEVYVNEKKAGMIAFNPYQLNVTSYLKKGNNQIEVRVIGSLKNLLGPHYRNPKPGLASPWHWKNIQKPISGNDYQMNDYGLMEDFDLIH